MWCLLLTTNHSTNICCWLHSFCMCIHQIVHQLVQTLACVSIKQFKHLATINKLTKINKPPQHHSLHSNAMFDSNIVDRFKNFLQPVPPTCSLYAACCISRSLHVRVIQLLVKRRCAQVLFRQQTTKHAAIGCNLDGQLPTLHNYGVVAAINWGVSDL